MVNSAQIPHPEINLPAELVARLRSQAPEAEQQGRLTPGQLDAIYQQQWFKLLIPARYGGLEMPLPELLRLEEALAWVDGSLGWTVTLCAGAGWFGGFLQPGMAQQLFAHPKVCLAGSGAVGGTAKKTAGGYIINGTWHYASGAHHATCFTANCTVQHNGKALLDSNGEPLIRSFVIPASEVKLVSGWKYMGMMGTGSDGFEIADVFVPQSACFRIASEGAVVSHPLYIYPFLQLAEATLAVNLSGMALRFLDLCGPVFQQKINLPKTTPYQQTILRAELDAAATALHDTRYPLFDAMEKSWKAPERQELLKAVSTASRQLAHTARECVCQLYPYCGLQAASPDTEINQVWRNFHTAGQHSLLTFME